MGGYAEHVLLSGRDLSMFISTAGVLRTGVFSMFSYAPGVAVVWGADHSGTSMVIQFPDVNVSRSLPYVC